MSLRPHWNFFFFFFAVADSSLRTDLLFRLNYDSYVSNGENSVVRVSESHTW